MPSGMTMLFDVSLVLFYRFLGYFQPQPDKPALWELGSDQHYNAARFLASSVPEISRYFTLVE